MKVLRIYPADRVTGGGFRHVARADVQVTSGIRMNGLEIVRVPDGRTIVYGPPLRGGRAATFDIDTGNEIATAVIAEMGGDEAYDRTD